MFFSLCDEDAQTAFTEVFSMREGWSGRVYNVFFGQERFRRTAAVLAFLFLLLFFPGRITVSGAAAKEAAADRAAAEKTAAEGAAAEAAAIEGTDAEAAAAEGLSAEEASGRDADKDEGVCIYVMTDPHYLSPELTDGGASFLKTVQNGDSKLPQYSDLYMTAFTDAVLDAEPDLVILSGDLTYNGERLSHEGIRAYCRQIEEAGIPVLVIPGNHDISNQNAVRFTGSSFERVENTDGDQFREIWQEYGYNEASSLDSASGSYIFEFSPVLWFLCLDVNSYSNNTVPGSSISWIQQQMARAERSGARVILVSHQNLLRHNSVFFYGYQIYNADLLIELFSDYKILCCLSGHTHLESVRREGDILEIVTSALAVAPNQYGILTLTDGRMRYHTERLDLPEEVREEAAAFSEARSREIARANMDEASLTDEEISLMTDTFLGINSAYAMGEALNLDKYWDGIRLWQEQPVSNVSLYLLSLGDDLKQPRNMVDIKIE